MLIFLETRHNSGRKVDKFLNFVHLALCRPTPHAETVHDVGKDIGLVTSGASSFEFKGKILVFAARPGPTPSRSLNPYISGTACLIDKRSSLMNTTWR